MGSSMCRTNETALHSDWIVDASGASSVSARLLDATDLTHTLRTQTRTTYGHYRAVGSWSQKLNELGHNIGLNPFDSDDAAQHHLLENGWLWMLRFNNGITSVGRTEWIGPEVLDNGGHSNSLAVTKAQSLPLDFRDYPSLAELMTTASFTAPPEGVRSIVMENWSVKLLWNVTGLMRTVTRDWCDRPIPAAIWWPMRRMARFANMIAKVEKWFGNTKCQCLAGRLVMVMGRRHLAIACFPHCDSIMEIH